MPEAAAAIVRDAIRRYGAERRLRIDGFVDRYFTFRGSLGLHRRALGWDFIRAPYNLFVAVPANALALVAALLRLVGARRVGTALGRVRLTRPTAVGREVEWLVMVELLELPAAQRGRSAWPNALARTLEQSIPADDDGGRALAQRFLADAGRTGFAAAAAASYRDTRGAAAQIGTALIALAVGWLAMHQVTASGMSLGPLLAGEVAEQEAIDGFPLGSWVGGMWYDWFPVAAPVWLIIALTVGLLVATALVGAFVNVLTDPAQRLLGLHRWRLKRLVDALERRWIDGVERRFTVRDQLAAHVFDVIDAVANAWRLGRL